MAASSFIALDKLTRFLSGQVAREGLVEVIVKFSGSLEDIRTDLNADIELLSQNYAIVTLPLDQLAKLYDYPQIEYIELPKVLSFVLRESLDSACIASVHSPTGLSLTGKGVIVGIIDSGIDYSHPDFRNSDGTTRIVYLWDQTGTGTPPQGFRNGVEYTQKQIDLALTSPSPLDIVPQVDTVGHGTAVAGVAAGNGAASGGLERGAAPGASLIVVKLGNTGNESFTRTTEIMRAVKYISDKALELHMPVSMNISYGTNNGSHMGYSLFDRYLDSMCERWKTVISVATGNEGAAGHHFSTVLTDEEPISIEFSVSGNPRLFYMTLWKNFVDTMTFELISPDGRSTGMIQPLQSVTYRTLSDTDVSVIYAQPTHLTTLQEVYFLFQMRTPAAGTGVWKLIARGEKIVDGRFNIWLPTVEDVSQNTTFLSPDINLTLTIPSTARSVISVGGYNSIIDIAAVFSGRGADCGCAPMKPDLVAPAVNIVAPKAGGGYDSNTGTSMAAPFVTGSAALMMEWGIVRQNDPFLFNQRVKAFLCRGARRKESLTYPNNQWGYGALSLCDTMNELVEYTRTGGAFM